MLKGTILLLDPVSPHPGVILSDHFCLVLLHQLITIPGAIPAALWHHDGASCGPLSIPSKYALASSWLRMQGAFPGERGPGQATPQ